MKQVNPLMNQKFGVDLGERRLDEFKDDQITQLYQLFVEIKKFEPIKINK